MNRRIPPSTLGGRRRPNHRSEARPSAVPFPVIRPLVAGIDIGSTEHWVAAPPHPDGQPNVRTMPIRLPHKLAWCRLAEWTDRARFLTSSEPSPTTRHASGTSSGFVFRRGLSARVAATAASPIASGPGPTSFDAEAACTKPALRPIRSCTGPSNPLAFGSGRLGWRHRTRLG